MARADVDAWKTYVTGELAKFYELCDGITYLWKPTPAAQRTASRLNPDPELAAFSGPWHVVRQHVTGEFRQWVEEHDATERLTLSQHRERAIAERAERAWSETPEHTLGRLIELRRLIAERDALILEACQRGASKVAIADAVGLSRQQVHAVIAAAELAPVIPIRPDVEMVPEVELTRLASGEWVEVF